MSKHVRAIVLALLLTAAISVPALAAPAGSALGVDPMADAAAGGKTRTLVVGADVFIGDLVETGPEGQVQILFADNTELVVGPRSSLLLEDYLLRNDGSPGQLAVNMLAGAFRFSTGQSAKTRYRIDTPTGTIGVRGTGFDVWVSEAGPAWLLLYHGSTISCSGSDDCKVSSAQCEVTQIGPAEVTIMGDARKSVGDYRNALKTRFIYAMNEAPLLNRFRIAHAFDCLHKPPSVYVDPGAGKRDPGKPRGRKP